ncbi:MAG TPA: tryptophan--tRNA ligase [Dehalococcoidia bacterium]|nr:tryptophan--tRNA ligase [Dehalococcoidia bacterium]
MEKTKKRILTGDRPTGPMHVGHYIGSLENRVRLQGKYDCFFIVADYQFLTDHLRETEKVEQNIRLTILDWLSVGMDPAKSTFFIQSMVPEIAELTMYFSMLVTVARLHRNPTVKEEFKESGLRAMSYGFLGYPVSQAADILIVRSDLVPVGDDNVPHVEQTREVARTFNRLFGEVFPVPKPLIGEVPRLPGTDGKKMGNSMDNAIYLSDTPEEVQQKVGAAITDPARIRATDKGHPDICNIYQYHRAYNREEALYIAELCRQGKIGCVACKQNLAAKLNAFLDPVRERRAFFEAKPSIIGEALREGNERTRQEGRETLGLVREAMHFNYKELAGG